MSEDPRAQLAQLQVQHAALVAQLADAKRALQSHEGAPVAIVTIDATSRIIATNHAARALLGEALQQIDELHAVVTAVLAGAPTQAEMTLRDRRVLVVATRESPSTVTCALVELPRYAHDALANLHAFASGLTHELNNKLQAVSANIELALVEEPALLPELLEDALTATESIADLSAQLAAYAGGRSVTRRPLDLATMLRVLEPVAHEHAGTAALMLDVCDALAVDGDVVQLSRAVIALVDEARDAGADRIAIVLTPWSPTADDMAALELAPGLPSGGYAVIAVRDDRRDPRPSGHRITIAETIASGHGGALTVTTHSGGVTARVMLPRR